MNSIADNGYQFKINKLNFNGDVQIEPRRINVIIGPNNSGKSRLLKEIRSEILGHPRNYGLPDYPLAVLTSIQLNLPKDVGEFVKAYGPLDKIALRTSDGWRSRGYCSCGIQINPDGYYSYSGQVTIPVSDGLKLQEVLKECINARDGQFEQFVGPLFVSYSGTEERLVLSIGEPARGLDNCDYNTLSAALDTDPYLYSISDTVMSLFGKDVILDVSSNRQVVRPLVSASFSEYRESVSGTHAPDNTQLSNASPLSEEGDGFRSFVSVLVSILGNKKPVYLLDEPESFLHPPFAFEMGKKIAAMVSSSGAKECQLFIATHSSYFIRGVLSEMKRGGQSAEVQIIRLAREGDTTRANVIETVDLEKLISTTGFTPAYVDALFSEVVVLTEGPRDAELFGQLAAKMFPMQDILFVPVNGKQNFKSKIDFYKKAGIKVRMVADFDLLKTVDELQRVVRAADVPDVLAEHAVSAAQSLHDAISSKMKSHHSENQKEAQNSECDSKAGQDNKTPISNDNKMRISNAYKFVNLESVNSYGEGLYEEINDIITQLINYGILIIRSGILESIFPEMSKTKNKEHSEDWYVKAIDYISKTEEKVLQEVAFPKDLKTLVER